MLKIQQNFLMQAAAMCLMCESRQKMLQRNYGNYRSNTRNMDLMNQHYT